MQSSLGSQILNHFVGFSCINTEEDVTLLSFISYAIRQEKVLNLVAVFIHSFTDGIKHSGNTVYECHICKHLSIISSVNNMLYCQ